MGLYAYGGLPQGDKLLPLQPASNVFLDEHSARVKPVRAELLEVGHLACTKEDLGETEPILVFFLWRGEWLYTW